jgi:hypothetical protein
MNINFLKHHCPLFYSTICHYLLLLIMFSSFPVAFSDINFSTLSFLAIVQDRPMSLLNYLRAFFRGNTNIFFYGVFIKYTLKSDFLLLQDLWKKIFLLHNPLPLLSERNITVFFTVRSKKITFDFRAAISRYKYFS